MSSRQLQLDDGRSLAIDDKGYLLDYDAWSPEAASAMAARDGIALDDDHWVVLELLRNYFETYEIEPPMRALVQRAKARLGEEKGSSRYLYRLFPDGPGTQGVRYAGLPRPLSCV